MAKITRTVKVTTLNIYVDNGENIEKQTHSVVGDWNKMTAKERNTIIAGINGAVTAKVEKTEEKMYAMSLEQFVANAKEVKNEVKEDN